MTGKKMWVLACILAGCAALGAAAQDREQQASRLAPPGASTDFLSNDEWRSMSREERGKWARASYVARFEPSGREPSLERVPDYITRYREINIYDGRLVVFRVHATHVEGTTNSLILDGEVSVAQYSSGIESTLRDLGFPVVHNVIQVLPAAALGVDRYGIVTTSSATIRREPRPDSEQVNSVAVGGRLRLLREAVPGDIPQASQSWFPGRRDAMANAPDPDVRWFLAQSAEGYVGFVRDDQLTRTAEYLLPDGMLLEPAIVRMSDGGATACLPAGAWVRRVDGSDGGGWACEGLALFAGTRLESPKVCPTAGSAFSEEEILSLSRPLMGTRYVWGGVTSDGIDCSGFTQFLLKARGVFLPRDSEEQATFGQIVAFGADLDRALPGDLIFFVNDRGKINHVAVALGGSRIIHSQGPGVHLATLDEKPEENGNRLRERVLFVRRVLTGQPGG